MIQDIIKARTASQFQEVIEDAAPVDLEANPQLVRSAEPPRSLAQLIFTFIAPSLSTLEPPPVRAR